MKRHSKTVPPRVDECGVLLQNSMVKSEASHKVFGEHGDNLLTRETRAGIDKRKTHSN